MEDGRILPYLDIPFQHGSPRILKSMKRPAATVNTLERIRTWRDICPDLSIRSTFIVGYPGETEDDFEQLLAFLEAAQLDRVGCFQYSPVAGAVANELPNPVADEIKQDRWDRLMQSQARISAEKLSRRIGRVLEVMVDTIEATGVVARSWADAPEIDGKVYIDSEPGAKLVPGQILKVRIERADDYDLWAQAVT
jgi:ribosomal protein S12 methylthiotransferase